MNYRVELSGAAQKQLRKIPEPYRKRIIMRLRGLRENPRPPGARKMSLESNMYRIRIGDYRVLYEIREVLLVVVVVKVGHRREVYR